MILTKELKLAIQDHARRAYPTECIGMVVAGKYVELENEAAYPKLNAYSTEATKANVRGTLQALVHSHCTRYDQFNRFDCPSAPDMQSQVNMDVPFILCTTDGNTCTEPFMWGAETPDLYERGFRHGVTDCYAWVRDHAKTLGRDLPEYPRSWVWWELGQDLFLDGFAKAGYRAVDMGEKRSKPKCAEVGDVLLFKIRSLVINHASVYVGNDTLHHHGSAGVAVDLGKLPSSEGVGRMLPFCELWLRYEQ